MSSIPIPCCSYNILFSTSNTNSNTNTNEDLNQSTNKMIVVESNTPLPISKTISLKPIPQEETPLSSTTNFLLMISISNLESEITIGQLVFPVPSLEKEFEACVNISLLGQIEVIVRQENQILESLSWSCGEGGGEEEKNNSK